MTPTVTKSGGSVRIDTQRRPVDGDTWSLLGLDAVVLASGDLDESPAWAVGSQATVDSDTITLVVTGDDLDLIQAGQWLRGICADGSDWQGWLKGVVLTLAPEEPEGEPEGEPEPEPVPEEEEVVDYATLTIDRPMGGTPTSVWDSRATIPIPALSDYGLLRLELELSETVYSASVECVENVLEYRFSVSDLLSAYPTLASQRSLFASPSMWDGLRSKAAELVDMEIRRRGDRTRLLIGDAQIRPALSAALRYVLAENGFYASGEKDYPLEAQKSYRDRMIAACDGLLGAAAFRSEGSSTLSERTRYKTVRCSR